MAVEPKRGCGYRRVGGLYLVTFGVGRHCGKMPVKCEVCPTCNAGIKPTRGWTWIDPVPLFGGRECTTPTPDTCPLEDWRLEDLGPLGLLWIGEKFYSRPRDFTAEAERLGISRRIPAIPKGFRVGETWVLFAHGKVQFADGLAPGLFYLTRPELIEKIVTQTQANDAAAMAKLAERGITPVIVPDIDPDHNPAAGHESDLDLLDAAE
jgi:hypothetical protein